MYSNIDIQETEISGRHLLTTNEKSFYIGYLTKEIIEHLQKGIPPHNISKLISKNRGVVLTIDDINDVIDSLNKKEEKNGPGNLIKLFNIINTKNITNIPITINKIYTGKCFYVVFILFFLINTLIFIKTDVHSKLSNLDLLFLVISVPIILLLHEFGHHISANSFGIKTDAIGFGIYGLVPVLYIHLGETWKLSTKKRNLINFAGIHTQLIIGIIIYLISLKFNNFLVLNNLMHLNFIVVLLNLNPFFKFDGYWITSDLLDMPNLLEDSRGIIMSKITLKSLKSNWGVTIYAVFRNIFIVLLMLFFIYQIYRVIILAMVGEFNYLSFLLPMILFVIVYKKIKYGFRKRKNKVQISS